MSATEVFRGAIELAAGIPHEGTARGVLLLVIAVGIPALAASLFAGVAGRVRASRAPVLAALAAAPIAIAFFAHVRTHTPARCHDCYSAYGGAYHPIELVATVMNIAAWSAGIVLAVVLRYAARRFLRNRTRPRAVAGRTG